MSWYVRAALAAAVLLSGALPASAQARDPVWLIPPVDGGISRHFEAPKSQWSRGHRGIDYLVPQGTSVRSAGWGEVTFAGQVAGSYAVTIAHGGGLETTYSQLSDVFVDSGQVIGTGHWIGEVGRPHAGDSAGLHFGVKLEGSYVDPLDFLGSSDVGEAIHLVPINGTDLQANLELAFAATGARLRPCETPPREAPKVAPNENVAVVIAGISSQTANGSEPPLLSFARNLGYEDSNLYTFSYRSLDGPRGHEPYTRLDTNRSLVEGARRLSELLRLIARRHPGADIDILAHSQGGIIARAYLSGLGREWAHSDPRVEHLVTLATPHRGARIAHLKDDLSDESLTGGLLARGVSWWARHGGPLPDPSGAAARELETDSDLIQWLASQDVTYGTRVLALAVPDDLIVSANRAAMPREINRVVPPQGMKVDEAPRARPESMFISEMFEQTRRLNSGPFGWVEVAADVGPEAARAARAHFRIMESDYARALAHSFLSDRPEPCPSGWDEWGPGAGMIVDAAEGYIGFAYGQVESLIATRLRIGIPYGAARIGGRIMRGRNRE